MCREQGQTGSRLVSVSDELIPRVMGLDVGDRRIGVAISDGLGLTAQPLFTLPRTGDGGGGGESATYVGGM